MKFNEKLQVLRKKKGMSQEALAEAFGVSRQAVSRWENGQVYPETEKLIAMSEFFDISLDALIKEQNLRDAVAKDVDEIDIRQDFNARYRRNYEYKSSKTLWGRPLVHINTGTGMKKAKGIIAIGNVANGIVSLGLVATGVISLGLLSFGLVSFGVLAIGVLFALGTISIGAIAFGAIALGFLSFGATAIGVYAQGALAIASRIAVGDHAYGYIAIGQTVADGAVEFLSSTGLLLDIPRDEVRLAINEAFPNTWNFVISFMTAFLGK